MRGSRGYPKGDPYNMVPQGLLLRPAIPNDEIFGSDGTYGPKANFKISLRELPDDGRFRVTVMAAKYNDGLLLDPGTPPQTSRRHRLERHEESGQRHHSERRHLPGRRLRTGAARAGAGFFASRRRTGRIWPATMRPGVWREARAGRFAGRQGGVAQRRRPIRSSVPRERDPHRRRDARRRRRLHGGGLDSSRAGPEGRALSVWARPTACWAGIWSIPTTRAFCGFKQRGGTPQANATVSSPPGVIRANTWQHVAAVVRRGRNETRLYVNGYLVARGVDRRGAIRRPEGGSPARARSRRGAVSGRIGGCAALPPSARRGRNSGSGRSPESSSCKPPPETQAES